MDTNQILLIIIVVLISVIVIFALYFLVFHLVNRKNDKKTVSIFNPENLVEEESLMNVMDEKKNVEFQSDEEKFVNNNEEVKIVSSDLTQQEKVNPFNIDMTLRKKDNTKITIEDDNKNKFIK